MTIVQIEHPVPNFDAWKKAFDSDPVSRERSGVRRYQVLRPVEGTVMESPRVRIVEVVESKEY